MRIPVVWCLSIAAALAFAVEDPSTVRDGAGRAVTVPARPARIVSLAPSVTEILFAIGAGDRVVGVTDFCDHPPEAASRVRIGGLINPDIERIVGLKPDLVVATTAGNYLDDAERIERLGVPVYTIHTPGVAEILETIRNLGALIGNAGSAEELAGRLRDRIDAVRAARAGARRPRTLFVIEPEPLIAPGRGTFIGEALEIAGARVVMAESSSRWAQYDIEQVIRMRPEVILTAAVNRQWTARIGSMPDWLQVPAVASGHVFVVSDAIQHPGPRLVDGIEEVADLLSGLDGGED